MLEYMRTVGGFLVWILQNLINLIWSYDILRWAFTLFLISFTIGIIVRSGLGIVNETKNIGMSDIKRDYRVSRRRNEKKNI